LLQVLIKNLIKLETFSQVLFISSCFKF